MEVKPLISSQIGILLAGIGVLIALLGFQVNKNQHFTDEIVNLRIEMAEHAVTHAQQFHANSEPKFNISVEPKP